MKIIPLILAISFLMVALTLGKVRKNEKKEVRYYGARPPANGTWTYVVPARPYAVGWWVPRPPRPATATATAGNAG